MKTNNPDDDGLVSELYEHDAQFRLLYDKHSELDKKINKAKNDRLLAESGELGKLKKEKLRIKDELEKMLQQNR